MVIGYVRYDGERWVAICLNLNLVAQADDPDEAMKKLVVSIEDYIQYMLMNYPEDWKQRLDIIECHEDFIAEFKEITKLMSQMAECGQRNQPHKTTPPASFASGFSTFATEVPATLAL